jgi:4'-phosphopantetheinyl transferase EntD
VIAPSKLFAALLPEQVVAYDAPISAEYAPDLFPEEVAEVARACKQRRLEFATERACARAALSRLGLPRAPLLTGPARVPAWSAKTVGSITHTKTFCASAVAMRESFLGIGIDAELSGGVTKDEWSHVLTAEELAWLGGQSVTRQSELATVIFSAKEAFFKCQFPMTREWLEFQDVHVRVSAQSYEVLPRRPLRIQQLFPASLVGAYRRDGDLVATAMAFAGRTGSGHP